MPSFTSSIVLASALAAAAQAAWVPATVKQVPGNGVHRRDLNATLAAALKPAHKCNLLYIDDSAPAQNMAINVNAEHDTNKYIVIEEFRDLISKMTCSPNASNKTLTDVNLTFDNPNVYQTAKKYWATDADLMSGKFLFITHDPDCSPDGNRQVYASDKVQFNQDSNRATITSELLELGVDPNASQYVTVAGGPYQQAAASDATTNEKRGLGSWIKSVGGDVTGAATSLVGDVKSAASSVKSAASSVQTGGSFLGIGGSASDSGSKGVDFPMDIEIKDKTLISSELLTLTCRDCHLTGQLSPAFSYKFLTDKATIAANLVEGEKGIKNIVQEASLNITATKDISAALDFEVSTKQSVDFTCTYPYGVCGVSIDGVGIGAKDTSLLGDGGFKFGLFQLNLYAALGITIEANLAAEIAMNWTASMDMPAGQFDSFDFVDSSRNKNTMKPTFKADKPSIELEDVQACITLGLGGTFNAGVAVDVGKNVTLIDTSIDVFVPRVVFCADDNKKSNDKCDGSGSTHVHHYNSTLTIGTDLSGTILGVTESTGNSLEAQFSLFDKCDVQDGSSSSTIQTSATKSSASSTGLVTATSATATANAGAIASAIASIVAGAATKGAGAATPVATPTVAATASPTAVMADAQAAKRYARLARYARY